VIEGALVALFAVENAELAVQPLLLAACRARGKIVERIAAHPLSVVRGSSRNRPFMESKARLDPTITLPTL
jgi:hypothetical protein